MAHIPYFFNLSKLCFKESSCSCKSFKLEFALSFFSPSSLDQCKERTIIVNGFSKSFAMTGWRLGVATGPSQIIEKMGLLLETTTSCVSPFIQRGGVEALLGSQKKIYEMVDEYRKKQIKVYPL